MIEWAAMKLKTTTDLQALLDLPLEALIDQANTIRHRRVLSLFQLGTLIISASDPHKISQLDLNDALKNLKHYEIIQ